MVMDNYNGDIYILKDLIGLRFTIFLSEHGLGNTNELKKPERKYYNNEEKYIKLLFLRDSKSLDELRIAFQQNLNLQKNQFLIV